MTVLGRDTSERLRDCAAVQGFVERVCFKTGPPGLVGTELEWLVAFEDDPTDAVPIPLLRELLDAAGPPPRGSRITFEPGGQLELSSPAFRGPTSCWQALHADVEHVRQALAAAGLRLLPTAIDPHRAPRRQLVHPRYDAMEAYFAATGADSAEVGPVMMTSTAALQVNLDIGSDLDEAWRRWTLLHTVGPTMVAAFANSPVHAGRDTGWKSARQHVWQRLDRARTSMPDGPDPATAWARVRPRRPGDAPAARRRRLDRRARTHVPRLAGRGRRPEPRRPGRAHDHAVPAGPAARLVRGALPRRAAVAVVAGADGGAHRPARRPRRPGRCRGGLRRVGRLGGRRPATASARRVCRPPRSACFDAALAALVRMGEHPDLVARVREFRDRYVAHGRSPADDPLDDAPEAS